MTPAAFQSIPFDIRMFPQTRGVYVVGGSTRDLLLNRAPSDYDIAVSQNPEIFAADLAASRGGKVVRMGHAKQAVFRVIVEGFIFDITALNGKCIQDDLSRRDFTINAMAVDLESGRLLDCFGGQMDLAKEKIRMVSASVFDEDPVRLLRAYRMAAVFGFGIDPNTVQAIARSCSAICQCAGERIRSEFFKILAVPASHQYLLQMAENGLLAAIFPELGALKGCLQNHRHEYDVFDHTLAAYGALENLVNRQDIGHEYPWINRNTANLSASSYTTELPLLKCAILFHDIGKPACRTESKTGGPHFYGHDKKGALLFEAIADRLRFSSLERQTVHKLIRLHIRPLHLSIAHQNGQLSRSGIVRFFEAGGRHTPLLLLQAFADLQGKGSCCRKDAKAFTAFIETLMKQYAEQYLPQKAAPPLATGHDLIHVFRLSPSPLFADILAEVETARLCGEIADRPAALAHIEERLKRLPADAVTRSPGRMK